MAKTYDNKNQENPLGTEPIGKLLRKFAVPSIISMVVMSLYNIVDEIFNDYVVRQGTVQPLFTTFCNGTTST